MDRYNYMYQDNRNYGRPNDFRERADRSDRRYDDFYADRGGVRRSGDWDRQPRYNRRGRGGGPYPGDKRRTDDSRRYSPSSKRRTTGSTTSKESPRKEKEEIKVDDIPDDEVVVPDTLMDSVEKLRMRKEVERNVADEDVEKLVVFCFTGKGYQCKTCGPVLTKKSAFSTHLTGKSHVMNVIEARTAKTYTEIREILEIDLSPDDWFEKDGKARTIIMKQSKVHMRNEREIKLKEKANYDKTPSNFFNFNLELRKSVTKKEEKVLITSLVESTVEVNDFTGEKYFGCEFIRAVTGFHCKLCSVNVREAHGVIPHVDSRQHQDNYAAYVKKNPEYEKSQKEQNKDLFDIMSQHEEKSVVLVESSNVKESHFLSQLDTEFVRIPSVMNPELKKKEKEKEKEKEKKEKEAAAAEKKKKESGESEKTEKEGAEGTKDDEEEGSEQEAGDDEDEEQGDEEVDDEEDQEDEVEEDEDKEDVEEEQVEENTEEVVTVVEPMEEDKEEEAESIDGSEGKEEEAGPEITETLKTTSKKVTDVEAPKSTSKKATDVESQKTAKKVTDVESQKTAKKATDVESQKTSKKATDVESQKTASKKATDVESSKAASKKATNAESPKTTSKKATDVEITESPKTPSKKATDVEVTESPKTTSKKATDEKATKKATPKVVKPVPKQKSESKGSTTKTKVTTPKLFSSKTTSKKPAVQEDSNDGSFMDGFEVVDEVKDDTAT